MKMIADIKVLNYHSKLISEDATQKSIFEFFFFFFFFFYGLDQISITLIPTIAKNILLGFFSFTRHFVTKKIISNNM